MLSLGNAVDIFHLYSTLFYYVVFYLKNKLVFTYKIDLTTQ